MKQKRFVLAGVAAAMAALPLALLMGPAHADTAPAPNQLGPGGVISGQAESFAMRIEYDLPLPAGSGAVAHVSAQVQRSRAGETAHGIAAAPTEMDAVVSGKYVDPGGTGHPQRVLPQTECAYPGTLLDTHFFFPTDTQAETKGLPTTGYATAQCGAGPQAELHSVDAGIGEPDTATAGLAPLVTAGQVEGDALAEPVKDTLSSDTASRASNVSLLGGVLKIGSVVAASHSATNGQPGGAASRSAIDVSDIDAGGVTFGVSTASTNGKETASVIVGGVAFPADSSQAQATLAAANGSLASEGCSLTLDGSPPAYPQGYLFSRPQPDLGVKPDGSLAASYRGGLLLTCDPPRSVTDHLDNFSPERAQVLIGFAYTSASAHGEVGGFGFGDLVTPTPGSGGGAVLGTSLSSAGGGFSTPSVPSLAAAPTESPSAAVSPPRASRVAPAAAVLQYRMGTLSRWLIGLLGLAVWGLLTHLGARRFLTATSACPPGREG